MAIFKQTSKVKTALQKVITTVRKLIDGDYLLDDIKINGKQLDVYGSHYFKMQDDGVRGVKGGMSRKGYHYRDKKPPASAFSRYTSDKNKQFAIANKIYQVGFQPKDLVKKIENDEKVHDAIEDVYTFYVDDTIYSQIKPK